MFFSQAKFSPQTKRGIVKSSVSDLAQQVNRLMTDAAARPTLPPSPLPPHLLCLPLPYLAITTPAIPTACAACTNPRLLSCLFSSPRPLDQAKLFRRSQAMMLQCPWCSETPGDHVKQRKNQRLPSPLCSLLPLHRSTKNGVRSPSNPLSLASPN